MRRILIVKTSSLGDVVHALPAVSDLLRAHRTLTVDWLVEESFRDIPALHPGIARVIVCNVRRWRRRLLSSSTWRELGGLRETLRQTSYDAVLDLQGLAKSAWLACMASGVRHGYGFASIRDPLASIAYHVRHGVSLRLHAIERNRRLAAAAMGYQANGDPDYGVAIPAAPDPAAPDLILFHGTSRRDKLWPEEYWRALLTHYAAQGMRMALPWGSEEERKRSHQLAFGIRGAYVPPLQSIANLARWCSSARGVIGVDTGLTHLAAAAGAPAIALYLASDPTLTGVIGGRSPARNLGTRVAAPGVADVIKAAEEIFRW